MPLSDSFVRKDFLPDDVKERERADALLDEMGLSDRDVKKLQAQMLSHKEAVIAKQEELTHIRQTKGRKPEWLEFLDVKARMGRVLASSEIIYNLRTVLPQLRCADGRVRDTISLFTPVTRTYEDGFHPGYTYLGWIHFGWNPEYTIDYCDEDGIPRGKRNGWRNILMHAITEKDGDGKWVLKAQGVVQNGTGKPLRILTEEQAEEAFGYPTNGEASSLYRRALYLFRNPHKIEETVTTPYSF